MWKPCVIKQHLEQPCLVSSEVHLPGRKGKSSLQEDGGGMEQMQLTACSQAVQHSTKPLPALQAETQPRQSLWLPTHTSYLHGTAVSQLTHLACALLSVNLAVQ